MFLVLIDANLKWLGVEVVPSASTGNTAKQLRSVFVTHGLPEILVTIVVPVVLAKNLKNLLPEMEFATSVWRSTI